jgi:hypothetical protein
MIDEDDCSDELFDELQVVEVSRYEDPSISCSVVLLYRCLIVYFQAIMHNKS